MSKAEEADAVCPKCNNSKPRARFWIACSNCDAWHHGVCVGISALKAEKLIHWYCKKCEKQQNTESTQTESTIMFNESVQTEPSVISHESTQTESAQAFSTVCVCEQTHPNLRVVGKCHMCCKYFHLYCIRTMEINGAVHCPSCNPQYDAILSVTNSNSAEIATYGIDHEVKDAKENNELFERKPIAQIVETERSENDESWVEEKIPRSQRVFKNHNRITKLSLAFKNQRQTNFSSSKLSQK